MLHDQIGEGTVGVIFKAQHSMLNRPAAIKLLRTNITPATLAQFETEVQLTSQLTSPNTVAVYDYGVSAEGLFYYVMEYLEGVTLGHIVRQSGFLPAGRAIHFLRQACNSLAEAHSRGQIHRDLKPENLMVCARGGVPDTIKVLDFELATIAAQCPEGVDHRVSFGVYGSFRGEVERNRKR
jgi:eukaryotic-like serine/threonine-protein kinase